MVRGRRAPSATDLSMLDILSCDVSCSGLFLSGTITLSTECLTEDGVSGDMESATGEVEVVAFKTFNC